MSSQDTLRYAEGEEDSARILQDQIRGQQAKITSLQGDLDRENHTLADLESRYRTHADEAQKLRQKAMGEQKQEQQEKMRQMQQQQKDDKSIIEKGLFW